MRIDALQKKLIAGFAVGVLAFGGIVVWPAVRESRQMHSQIVQAQQQLLSTQAQTSGLAALVTTVKQIRMEINTNNKRIPNQGEVAELLRELTTELQRQQLIDPAITSQPILPGPSYVRLPIQIAVKGPALGAFGFINRVEAMTRLVQLQRLHLQTSEKHPDQIEAEMDLHTFTYTSSQESAP